MAELVEEGFDFVEGYRAGDPPPAGRNCTVSDEGAMDLPSQPGAAETRAPGAGTLPGARVIIDVKDREMRGVRVFGFENLRPGGTRECPSLGESEPIEFLRDPEGAVADVFQLEVGAKDGLIKLVFSLTDLFGVIKPVPRFELKTVAVGLDRILERLGFAGGDGFSGAPEPIEQVIDPGGVRAMFSSRLKSARSVPRSRASQCVSGGAVATLCCR